MPWNSWSRPSYGYYYDDEDEATTWYEHFAKGFASMGVLGFLKVLLASPLSYFRMGGGGRGRTGRDRVEQVSWIIIVIGVGTFLAVRPSSYNGPFLHCLPEPGCIQRCSRMESSSARTSWRTSRGRSERR
jgi:hypothetical protein